MIVFSRLSSNYYYFWSQTAQVLEYIKAALIFSQHILQTFCLNGTSWISLSFAWHLISISSMVLLLCVQIHDCAMSYSRDSLQQGQDSTKLTDLMMDVAHLLHILPACYTRWYVLLRLLQVTSTYLAEALFVLWLHDRPSLYARYVVYCIVVLQLTYKQWGKQ